MTWFGPARGMVNQQDAPDGAAAGRAAGSDGLNHLAYLYDDERDYLSCLSAFVQRRPAQCRTGVRGGP